MKTTTDATTSGDSCHAALRAWHLLCGALLFLPVMGCATGAGGRGASGAVTTAQLQTRNKALEDLRVQALEACKTKGKPEDSGVFVVSAKPDGTVVMGPMQWSGSEETKQCLMTEAQKAHLPTWSGPTVSWLWAMGTKDHPPPQALANPPESYRIRMGEQVAKAQGNTGMGNDASTGPLAACAQASLPPEVYAWVNLRLFIFPDGKVVGATPIAVDGEGKDAAYIECAEKVPMDWSFDTFPGPAFTTLDVPLKFGVNPTEK